MPHIYRLLLFQSPGLCYEGCKLLGLASERWLLLGGIQSKKMLTGSRMPSERASGLRNAPIRRSLTFVSCRCMQMGGL